MKAALILLFTATPALAQHAHPSPVAEQPLAPPESSAPADHGPAAPEETKDHHAAHGSPEPSPHAGHDAPVSDPPAGQPPAAALSGPGHAADDLFGAPAMSAARKLLRKEHGGITSGRVFIDQLEATLHRGEDGYAWRADAWYGGDIDRLWLKTEGEGSFGEPLDDGEVQALWSHAISPWFDLQMGLRQDFGRGPDRIHAVIGAQGVAPYWIVLDAALFLSDKGDLSARVEAEYDLRLRQRLILQPRAEMNFSAQDVPEINMGSGLATAEWELRLRYEFRPEFAPYVGIGYQRAFGETANYLRAQQLPRGGWSLLAGVKAWF